MGVNSYNSIWPEICSLYAGGDMEGMLALPLEGLCLGDSGGATYRRIALSLARDCPAALKRRHIMNLLRVAYALYGYGELRDYHSLMAELKALIVSGGDGADRERLLGEWEMVAALSFFPDAARMRAAYLRAEGLLRGRVAQCISPEEPFLFGCPSMWFLFHGEPGTADAAGDALSDMLSLYAKLTGGHGSGADTLFRGELACMRGDLLRAEILANKACYAALDGRQTSVALGAALLIGRVAISRSDTAGVRRALKLISDLASADDAPLLRYCADAAFGMLMGMMEQTGRSAKWLRDGALRTGAMMPSLGMVNYVHVTELILRREYARAIGNLEAALASKETPGRVAPRHYIHIGLCVCYLGLGDPKEAARQLVLALDVSLPDGILSTFVRFLPVIEPLFALEPLQPYAYALVQIQALGLRFPTDADAAVGLASKKPPRGLTAREHDVARLGARGMRNSEIASTLNIKESTVKQYMHVVFQKLDIDRRSELAHLFDRA